MGEVQLSAIIFFRGKKAEAKVLLTDSIPISIVSEEYLKREFGEIWRTIKTPYRLIRGKEKAETNKIVTLQSVIQGKTYTARLYVSDEMIKIMEKSVDMILGKDFLEKNKLRLLT